LKFQIPNHKSQINPRLQFQMTETVLFLFGIWTIGIYLLFGACNLVLLLRSQFRRGGIAILRKIIFVSAQGFPQSQTRLSFHLPAMMQGIFFLLILTQVLLNGDIIEIKAEVTGFQQPKPLKASIFFIGLSA